MTSMLGARNLVRRVAAGVSLYTLALVLSGSIRLLAVLWIVRVISPTAYGTYATLAIVMWGIQAGGDLGLGTAALRFAPECKTGLERRSLFATMLSARALVAAMLTALVIVVHEPLARWLTGNDENGRALLWLALSRPPAMVFEGLLDELRARDAMGKVSALIVIWALFIQGMSVALVVGAGLDLMGLVWARVAGDALICGLALTSCWRFVIARPSLDEFRRLLAFGWPIGVMYALGMLRGLDRPLIRSLTALDRVAIYELAHRLVGPIGLFNISLGKVLEPVVYSHAQARSTAGYIDLFFRVYVAIFAAVAMALSVIGPDALRLLAPEPYHEASRALPALAFATACEGLMHVAGIGADLAKRTRVWAGAAILTLVIGLPLAALLVPVLGVAGAGLGWVVASAVTAAFAYRVAHELSGIVLPVWRALAVIVLGAALGTAAAWDPWPLGLRLALLAAFGFGAWRALGVRWSSLKTLW